jgi:intraflagellar transport protein 81
MSVCAGSATHHQPRRLQAYKKRREETEKATQGNKAYLQLRQAQQMAAVVVKKREDVQAKLDRLLVRLAVCQLIRGSCFAS